MASCMDLMSDCDTWYKGSAVARGWLSESRASRVPWAHLTFDFEHLEHLEYCLHIHSAA